MRIRARQRLTLGACGDSLILAKLEAICEGASDGEEDSDAGGGFR